MSTLGVDVGASKVHYVVLENGGKIAEGKFTIPQKKDLQSLLSIFKQIKEELQEKGTDITEVGVGLPGIIEEGKLVFAPNFPNLLGVPLYEELRKLFKTPVVLNNDANAFTYAEVVQGAVEGLQNVIGLTLGSGLGGGLVIEGKLYVGRGGAEIGHTVLNLRDDQEAEELVSSKLFTKQGRDPVNTQKDAESGNEEAQNMYMEFGRNLGHLVANLVNILDPEAIVLGGGLSEAYDLFIKSAKETAAKHIVNPKSKDIPIRKSTLGRASGAIGAALLAQPHAPK